MTSRKRSSNTSRLLSLVLRHKPETINLTLDEAGWAEVDHLLQRLEAHGHPTDHESLKEMVKTNNKQRFAFNDDMTKIRANQGHSIDIDHGYMPVEPPEILYHGTAEKSVQSILTSGLEKRNRHHVHLSEVLETAISVGKRHGAPVILEVKARLMYQQGYEFYCSENQVWLTEEVPAEFLAVLDSDV